MDILKKLLKKNETKLLLVVADGLGGAPHPDYGYRTELEVANKPNLDKLARHSVLGLTIPVEHGITPGSGPAHLSLFGYDPIEIQIGRGVLGALGIGFHLGPNDVAARGNFATIHDGVVVDRRAGRISSEECSRLIKKLSEHIKSIDGVEVILRPGKEHRFVAIFRGEGLSDKLSDADPQKDHMPLVEAKPLAAEASRTADVVNKFIRKANEILRDEPQANGVLLRGFAKSPKIEPFPEKYQLRAVALAVYPMYKGLTRLLGLETPDVGETFEDEVKALKELWNNYDFFYIHFKDTDKAGEDGDFELKVKKIEYFDKFVPVFVDLNPDVLVITGDHSTPAIIGGHSWHPNPTLLHSKVAGVDDARFFTEKECAKGYLGIFYAKYLINLMLANAGRLKKFGA